MRKYAKRITFSIPEEQLKWLADNIQSRRFYNYQHAIEYCVDHVMENKCNTISEDLAARIERLIESGKLGYLDRKSFVLDCIRKTLKDLGYAP